MAEKVQADDSINTVLLWNGIGQALDILDLLWPEGKSPESHFRDKVGLCGVSKGAIGGDFLKVETDGFEQLFPDNGL